MLTVVVNNPKLLQMLTAVDIERNVGLTLGEAKAPTHSPIDDIRRVRFEGHGELGGVSIAVEEADAEVSYTQNHKSESTITRPLHTLICMKDCAESSSIKAAFSRTRRKKSANI